MHNIILCIALFSAICDVLFVIVIFYMQTLCWYSIDEVL